jgi:hypothetical protein
LHGTFYGATWELGQFGIQLRDTVIAELETLYRKARRWIRP